MQGTEEVTHAEKQLDRVRKALTVNPVAIVMILPDEEHRELAQAAFEKQHKNAVAAKGTISALTKREDPTLDQIIEGLSHLQQIAVNARPAQHQLDGTPIGAAIEQQQNGHARRGGAPQTVGAILSQHPAGGTDIQWADEVPQPRPAVGQLIRLPNGLTTSIEAVYGYAGKQGDVDAFDVNDTVGYRGLVFAHSGEWRLVSQQSEYTDQEGAEPAPATESSPEATADAAQRAESSSDDTPPEGFNWPAGDLSVDEGTADDEQAAEQRNFSGSDDLANDSVAEEQARDVEESMAQTSGEAKGKKRASKVSRSKLQKGKSSKKK